MARKIFDVEIPDGQHLGFSRDTDGAYRAHLFDDETNDLVGHAELFERDAEENQTPSFEYIHVSDSDALDGQELTDEELEEGLEALLSLAIIAAMLAVKAAPHVTSWWRDSALPTLKSVSGTAFSAVKSANQSTIRSIRLKSDTALLTVKSVWGKSLNAPRVEDAVTSRAIVPANIPENRTSQLEISFSDYRSGMSSTEARERFVAALVARAFSDQQLRALRDANIEDDGNRTRLDTAMKALTPQRVEETLLLLLEKNPSLLELQSISELRTIFSADRNDGEALALRIERPGAAPGQIEP